MTTTNRLKRGCRSFNQPHTMNQAVDLGPMHINAHSGCDAWEEGGEALRFFEGALALQVRFS